MEKGKKKHLRKERSIGERARSIREMARSIREKKEAVEIGNTPKRRGVSIKERN